MSTEISKEKLSVKRKHPNRDKSNPTRVVVWQGSKDVRIAYRGKPLITEPKDAIVRVTSTTICGSDLHMYRNMVNGMKAGDILGHEFMGVIEEVGTDVKDLKAGDRVVASFAIACGECEFCKKCAFTCCKNTNPSKKCETMLGGRLSGAFGYTHLTGGYDGGQAEFVRVPIADVNLLKVPDDLPDDKLLFLSDIVCTGWHANELGEVSEGQVVAIWGSGPVGLMAAAWAKFRGASEVVVIDNVEYRLRVAREKLGCHTINFDNHNVVEALKEMFPDGPDVCIEAAGFRFPKSLTHKILTAVKLEGDALDILTEMIMVVKKNGTISIVGDYFGYGNRFPIGPFMEKSLTMRGGQTFVQRYWKELLGHIVSGKFDPTFVITHHMELEDAPNAYKLFDNHDDEMIKVILTVDPHFHKESH